MNQTSILQEKTQRTPYSTNEFTPLTHQEYVQNKNSDGKKINGIKLQIKKMNHISKYAHITLYFQESLKIMSFQNYNISGIGSIYELKLRILNQLSAQRLFISDNLKLYIDRSEVQINEQTVNDRLEFENKKPINILVFSSLSPILNPTHKYQMNKQKAYQISNFSIEYEDKKITWIEKTDISYINFNEIVTNNLEIYNLNKIGYFRIPNQGQKLNKRRLIKQVIPEELVILSTNNEGQIDEDYIKIKVQEQCQLLNQEFYSIDTNAGFYEYYQE